MNTLLKIIVLILLGVLVWIALAKLTNYDERMRTHNKYQCAVYGYEEDCKTPLPPERRLK